MDETREYEWTDNPTVSGESDCNTDVLNECLMHLKYNNSGGEAFPLFSTMAFDHVLSGDEAIGWALQGSLVTNTYTDAVEQIKNEYNNATEILNYSKKTPVVLPEFTSNTTGGITVSDSRSNTDAYTLINGVTSKYIGNWNTYWFNINYNKPTILNSYFIKADSNGNPQYPSAWTLQGSNDAEQWDTIDTRTGQTFTLGQSRTFIVTTNNFYQQYRIVFSDGLLSSGNGELGQLGFNVETVAYSFNYKKAQNGHLIADIMYKPQIDVFFSEKGIADFYILDSVNNQFYLPRNKYFHQFTDDTNIVNNFNEQGLPDIEGTFYQYRYVDATGAFKLGESKGVDTIGGGGAIFSATNTSFEASRSNPIYGNSDSVQPPSSSKLLYYKVGNTIVNESEIDAANLVNDVLAVQNSMENKANTDLSNCTKPYIKETYQNGSSWYRVYSDGWCEQGGFSDHVTAPVSLLKSYNNTDYNVLLGNYATTTFPSKIVAVYCATKLQDSFNISYQAYAGGTGTTLGSWYACGYISQGE